VALLGLNVLTGFSGQVSLGHGAFMALGGYTTAILIVEHGVRDLWTIPVGGVVAGIVGLVFGPPATRLTGAYLALATFGIAVALPAMIKKAEGWSGGSTGLNLFGVEGLSGLGIEVTFLGRRLTYNDWLYYLCWTVAVVLFAAAWLLLRGRLGRAFRAIRDSEVAAASAGVAPAAYKTAAFGISAFYAGVAGSLYALAVTFVNPEVFPVTLSIFLLVGVVMGGLGTLWTTVFGALFIQFLPDLAQRISSQPGSPAIVYAVVLVALMLVLPGGLGGLVTLANRVYHRRP
jgi:branched-chain amino acid transport system permease protein